MVQHIEVDQVVLINEIKQGNLVWGGNKKLKIYGTLQCASGKRMKRQNRVFFNNEIEALKLGYRPCGHCLKTKYKLFKNGTF
ncbi:MAG: metal-binding protein [Pedobacter sp.]|nr:MAG: metal-binding protein [Pedobacter sp.]